MVSIQFGSLMNRDLRYTPANLYGLGTETSKKTARYGFNALGQLYVLKLFATINLFLWIFFNLIG